MRRCGTLALLFTTHVIALLLVPTVSLGQSSYMCVSGVLYKPDGSEIYVGRDACASAQIFGSLACVGGSVYLAKGQATYVGADACRTARLSPTYICAREFLYHVSGWNQFVGSGCPQAVFAGDSACVSGMLYKPDGSAVYVGQNGCRTLMPR